MLKQGETIQRSSYDHATGRFQQPAQVPANSYMLYVGLHPFYLKRMRDMFDIKIYMDPAEELRRLWKINEINTIGAVVWLILNVNSVIGPMMPVNISNLNVILPTLLFPSSRLGKGQNLLFCVTTLFISIPY